MAWIKQGSYYHGLVAQQGHLHKCPHLAGVPLPRRPQITPSESRWESQKKVDTLATSSSEPNTGAMVAPITETPVMETPVTQTPVVETGIDEEFQQDRPVKRCRSQSRRQKSAWCPVLARRPQGPPCSYS